MDTVYDIVPGNILQALGWAVLHSLWQAGLIALLLAAYLLFWEKKDVRRRYVAGCLAMTGTLLFPVITFLVLLENGHPAEAVDMVAMAAADEVPGQYFAEDAPSTFKDYFSENMPLIVAAWFAGMVFFLLRALGGLLYIQRLKTRRLAAVPEHWQAMAERLRARLGISQKTKIAVSALVRAPMVVGWLKPLVLIPVAAVNHLTTEQVEAILAHELAHVARQDYIVNILQAIVEAVFYFNPAVWWISARIRTERENCCDDLAVAACGNAFTYTKALVSLQEMKHAQPVLALAFSKNKNELLSRIQRILKSPDKKSNVMEKFSATVLLLAAVLLLSVQAQSSLSSTTDTANATIFGHAPMLTDTLPQNSDTKNGRITIIKQNGDIIELQMKNGETVSAKINGKQVPQEKLAAYKPENIPPDEIATIEISKTEQSDDGDYPKGNLHINHSTDGEEIELRMKDGKITYLEIDGEVVPPSEYADHESLVKELINNVPPPPPAPPAPPAPPSFDRFPVPAPPAPPSFDLSPIPAPPAPPAPPARTRTITTEKNGKGMTIIIENDNGEDPIEIEIDNHRKGNLTINGNEIKGLKDGDRTVIKQELPGTDGFYFPETWTEAPFPEMFFDGGFEFPEMPTFDGPESSHFKALLEAQSARQQALLERLENSREHQRELSEEQAERLRERAEYLELRQQELLQHLEERQEDLLQRLEEQQLDRLERLRNREGKSNYEHDLLLNERSLSPNHFNDILRRELAAKMEAHDAAIAELRKNGLHDEAAKLVLESQELLKQATQLENHARLLQKERGKLLHDEYRGAQ